MISEHLNPCEAAQIKRLLRHVDLDLWLATQEQRPEALIRLARVSQHLRAALALTDAAVGRLARMRPREEEAKAA